MISEVEMLRHLYNIMFLLWILQHLVSYEQIEIIYITHPFSQIVQYLDLDEGLMVEPLLIPDDLYRH